MRPLKRPWLVFAIAVAVVALPAAASGALSGPAAPGANSATFQDSTGEDPAAPDISTIVASNDDAATISFKISIPNRPTYSSDIVLDILLDSDANPSTGDATVAGADYIIDLFRGEAVLFHWNGAAFPEWPASPTQASLSYSWTNGVATIKISAADLGNTRKLNFRVVSLSGLMVDDQGGVSCPDPDCPSDGAPAIGFYTYQLQVTKPTLVVRSLKPTPAKPLAGKPFTLRLVAARSDTGAIVQNGRATCVGRLGSARLKVQVQRVQGGAATCTWNLPASAKGKTFRGTVSVAFEGLKASQSYTGKVH